MNGEALHHETMHRLVRTTAKTLVLVCSLLLPVVLLQIAATRQWGGLAVIPLLFSIIYVHWRFPLRAQRVFVVDRGIDVLRRGQWAHIRWSKLGALDRVPLMSRSPVVLYRLELLGDEAPVLFYGTPATEVRFEGCRHREGPYPVHQLSADLGVPLEGGTVLHAPGATRWTPPTIGAMALVSVAHLGGQVYRGAWLVSLASAAVATLLACAARSAFRTARLRGTAEHVLIELRDGRSWVVPWSSVRWPELTVWSYMLPLPLAQLYALRVEGAAERVLFFSNDERLRRWDRLSLAAGVNASSP